MKDRFYYSLTAKHYCWLFFLLLLVLKLLIIRNREIYTGIYDSYTYLMSATKYYWGNEYSVWFNCRQPIYPLFLSINMVLGFPLRITIELINFICMFIYCLALKSFP
jgi:hypothetical protein